MRRKGRWKPELRIRSIQGPVHEVNCGMGLTELKKEVDYFRIEPVRQVDPPRWKKPVIIGSLWASGAAIGLGMMLAGSGIGLLLLVAGLAWLAVVAGANATVKKERYPNWMASTKPRSRRVNARKRSGRTARSLATAQLAVSRSEARRNDGKATGTLTVLTARSIGTTAGRTTARAC